MISPPILVSKANVMIGYNPIYEYAALPDVERIVAAIRNSVSTKHERAMAVAAGVGRGVQQRQNRELRSAEDRRCHLQREVPVNDASKRLPCRSWAKEFATRKSFRF